MSDEDHIEGGNDTLILIIALALMSAWLHAKEQQTEKMIMKEVNPITRESFGPYYINEMERKLAKAEMRRPKGCFETFKPVCPRKEKEETLTGTDRSGLAGIIIEGAMNERH